MQKFQNLDFSQFVEIQGPIKKQIGNNRNKNREQKKLPKISGQQFKRKGRPENKKDYQSNKEYQNNYPHWSDYEDKSFGWFAGIAVRGSHTSKTTYNMFKNMFNLKKVVDIDEYLKTFSLKIEKLGSAQYINSEDDLFECLSDSEGQWISTSVYDRWSSRDVFRHIDPDLLPQKNKNKIYV
jgi:hypothetical protein